MKKSIYLILSLTVILILNACSSVKVLNSWKADNGSAVNDKNFIVIARTDNNQARIAFENEIVNQLASKGIKSSASFTTFPKLNPDQEVTEDRKGEIISTLKTKGFNAVVLTVIKEIEQVNKTTYDGAHYAGGNYYGFYPRYYGGFHGYYHHPMSYSTLGVYQPESFNTSTLYNYVLETLVYNLDEIDEKQLVAVVTSKVENPQNASKTAKEYVKAITKSFDNK